MAQDERYPANYVFNLVNRVKETANLLGRLVTDEETENPEEQCTPRPVVGHP